MKRRDFLKLGIAAGSAAALGLGGVEARRVGLPKRKLGRTGEELSILGMGGIVLCGNDQHAADRIVGSAFDRGVNYFDVAPSYGNGEAEERLGPALKPYRSRAFLACKTTKRDKVGAAEELRSSLKRLQTAPDGSQDEESHFIDLRGNPHLLCEPPANDVVIDRVVPLVMRELRGFGAFA